MSVQELRGDGAADRAAGPGGGRPCGAAAAQQGCLEGSHQPRRRAGGWHRAALRLPHHHPPQTQGTYLSIYVCISIIVFPDTFHHVIRRHKIKTVSL